MRVDRWLGRRVLVTGHSGFKGTWLTRVLSRARAEVFGLSLDPPTEPSLFALAPQQLAHDGRADVRDLDAVRTAMQTAQPEVVLHLAAQALVRHSYVDPVETFSTNVMGTLNVLEAVTSTPSVRAVVIVTTDKVYENDGLGRPFAETSPLGGHDPYSASKAAAELVTHSYRASFLAKKGVLVGSARAGNVIGGGDFARDRLLPDLIRAFESGVVARIRNPKATRPFQHVLDPVFAYIALAERLLAGDASAARAYNFGPPADEVLEVHQVADRAVAAWGAEARWDSDPGPHPVEAPALALDPTKADAELGVRSLFGSLEAVERTVAFHRALSSGETAFDLMEREIGEAEHRLESRGCKDERF